ncbi:hypothetical protein Hanom_Chr04g00293111 [Helianthus anomalus]
MQSCETYGEIISGVLDFDNDQNPPLYPEEHKNCRSLVAATLIATIIALPSITGDHLKESLHFVGILLES